MDLNLTWTVEEWDIPITIQDGGNPNFRGFFRFKMCCAAFGSTFLFQIMSYLFDIIVSLHLHKASSDLQPGMQPEVCWV